MPVDGEVQCGICLQDVCPGNADIVGDDAAHMMACFHWLHAYCAKQASLAMGCHLKDLRCPVCRHTQSSLARLETEVVGTQAIEDSDDEAEQDRLTRARNLELWMAQCDAEEARWAAIRAEAAEALEEAGEALVEEGEALVKEGEALEEAGEALEEALTEVIEEAEDLREDSYEDESEEPESSEELESSEDGSECESSEDEQQWEDGEDPLDEDDKDDVEDDKLSQEAQGRDSETETNDDSPLVRPDVYGQLLNRARAATAVAAAPTTSAAPKPAAPPKPRTVAKTAAAKKTAAAPKPKAVPKTVAAPKTTAASKLKAVPKTVAAPKTAAAPKLTAVPKTAAAPLRRSLQCQNLAAAPEVEEPVPTPSALSRPPCGTDGVYCSWCNSMVHPSKARLQSKHKETYKCGKCISSFSKLNTEFGTWPSAEFKKLDEATQAKFYKDAGDIRDRAELAQRASEAICSYTREEKKWEEQGEFLPLSVYDRRGFDTERIKNNTLPADIIENPQLGTCYRVKILQTGRSGCSGTEQKSSAAVDKTPAAAHQPSMGLKRPLEPTDCSAGVTIDFAEKIKKLKLEQSETAKKQQETKTVANLVLKKLGSSYENLKLTLQSSDQLPPNMKTEAEQILKKAGGICAAAEAALNNPAAPPTSFDSSTAKEVDRATV